ncbi:MAG: hypothetical protein Kow00124_20310 [Anaerolineae bacterium]
MDERQVGNLIHLRAALAESSRVPQADTDLDLSQQPERQGLNMLDLSGHVRLGLLPGLSLIDTEEDLRYPLAGFRIL